MSARYSQSFKQQASYLLSADTLKLRLAGPTASAIDSAEGISNATLAIRSARESGVSRKSPSHRSATLVCKQQTD
jgi:hypothetical protein